MRWFSFMFYLHSFKMINWEQKARENCFIQSRIDMKINQLINESENILHIDATHISITIHRETEQLLRWNKFWILYFSYYYLVFIAEGVNNNNIHKYFRSEFWKSMQSYLFYAIFWMYRSLPKFRFTNLVFIECTKFVYSSYSSFRAFVVINSTD